MSDIYYYLYKVSKNISIQLYKIYKNKHVYNKHVYNKHMYNNIYIYIINYIYIYYILKILSIEC